MDTKTITRALDLPEDASDRDIIDRITTLREEAGEDDIADLSERELLRRGEHERISIDGTGATVSLYFPIRSGTESIDTLMIRRPTAKHLRRMQDQKGNDLGRTLFLLAELTG